MKSKRTASSASLPRVSSLGRVMSFSNLQYNPNSKMPKLRSDSRSLIKQFPSDVSMQISSSSDPKEQSYYSDQRLPDFFLPHIHFALKQSKAQMVQDVQKLSDSAFNQKDEEINNHIATYKNSDNFKAACHMLTDQNKAQCEHLPSELSELAEIIALDAIYGSSLSAADHAPNKYLLIPKWIETTINESKI